ERLGPPGPRSVRLLPRHLRQLTARPGEAPPAVVREAPSPTARRRPGRVSRARDLPPSGANPKVASPVGDDLSAAWTNRARTSGSAGPESFPAKLRAQSESSTASSTVRRVTG